MPPRRTGLQTRCAVKDFFGQGREPRVPPQIKRRSRFIPIPNPTDRLSFIGPQRGRQRQCRGRAATAISDTRGGQRHGTIAIRLGGDERMALTDASRVTRRATAWKSAFVRRKPWTASRRSGANAFARLDRLQPALANCTAGVPAQPQRGREFGANVQLYLRISCRSGSPVRRACSATDALPAGGRADPRNVPIMWHQGIESATKKTCLRIFYMLLLAGWELSFSWLSRRSA